MIKIDITIDEHGLSLRGETGHTTERERFTAALVLAVIDEAMKAFGGTDDIPLTFWKKDEEPPPQVTTPLLTTKKPIDV